MSALPPTVVGFGWRFEPNQELPASPCEWCQHSDRVTAFRVYGRPREDEFEPVRCEDCCHYCVAAVAQMARAECRDDGEIVIEYRVDPDMVARDAEFERIFGR